MPIEDEVEDPASPRGGAVSPEQSEPSEGRPSEGVPSGDDAGEGAHLDGHSGGAPERALDEGSESDLAEVAASLDVSEELRTIVGDTRQAMLRSLKGPERGRGEGLARRGLVGEIRIETRGSVSYTHLTLPTIYSV